MAGSQPPYERILLGSIPGTEDALHDRATDPKSPTFDVRQIPPGLREPRSTPTTS
jgi:hypothetical protein